VGAWYSLSEPLKAAILAIARMVNVVSVQNSSDAPPPVSGETTNPAEHKES
jgi:hypothetical protein